MFFHSKWGVKTGNSIGQLWSDHALGCHRRSKRVKLVFYERQLFEVKGSEAGVIGSTGCLQNVIQGQVGLPGQRCRHGLNLMRFGSR